MKNKKVYFNDPQRKALYILANQEYHVWGRRTGKSHGLTGPRSLENVKSMPRSYGSFIGPSYKMLLSQILPNTFLAWQFYGIYEDVHYVVNKRPPEKWRWPHPFVEPRNYENTIIFYNGSIIVLITQDRVGTSNSRSLDWIIADEAKFLNYDRFKTETMPALSGSYFTLKEYGEHYRFKSAMYCTDMPVLKKSQWIFNFKNHMDPEIINLILTIRKKLSTTKSIRIRKEYFTMLNKLRRNALYYSEANAIDNIKILGTSYLKEQKRNLPAFEFNTAILNIKPGPIEGGFYSSLNEVHYYTCSNIPYLEQYGFNKGLTPDCRSDGDLNTNEPLRIACDYNANINWLVVGQIIENEFRTVNSFFVKIKHGLKHVVTNFCDYYEYYPNRNIVFYYNTTALNSNYAVSADDFKDVVINELTKRKWDIEDVYMGQPMAHNLKHLYINQALRGENYLFPTFNKENNESLIFAMEQTGIRQSSEGFKKDKSGEKDEETPENPLELRTDGTDAWDDLFIGVNFFSRHSIGGYSTASILSD